VTATHSAGELRTLTRPIRTETAVVRGVAGGRWVVVSTCPHPGLGLRRRVVAYRTRREALRDLARIDGAWCGPWCRYEHWMVEVRPWTTA
jgi:hypothetical protein